MKKFACRDLGMDCNWTATGESDDEILAKAGEHGRSSHGMKDVGQDIFAKVKRMIRDEKSS